MQNLPGLMQAIFEKSVRLRLDDILESIILELPEPQRALAGELLLELRAARLGLENSAKFLINQLQTDPSAVVAITQGRFLLHFIEEGESHPLDNNPGVNRVSESPKMTSDGTIIPDPSDIDPEDLN